MFTKRQPLFEVVVAVLLGGVIVGLMTTGAFSQPVCGLARPLRDARRSKRLACPDQMAPRYKFSIC